MEAKSAPLSLQMYFIYVCKYIPVLCTNGHTMLSIPNEQLKTQLEMLTVQGLEQEILDSESRDCTGLLGSCKKCCHLQKTADITQKKEEKVF